MTQNELIYEVNKLAACYNKTLRPELLETWYEHIGDYDIELAEEVFKEVVIEREYMPTLGIIKKKLFLKHREKYNNALNEKRAGEKEWNEHVSLRKLTQWYCWELEEEERDQKYIPIEFEQIKEDDFWHKLWAQQYEDWAIKMKQRYEEVRAK